MLRGHGHDTISSPVKEDPGISEGRQRSPKKNWKNYSQEAMEERAEHVDWSSIFREVKTNKDLYSVLHDKINWLIIEVAPSLTLTADPDYIGQ